MQRLYLWKDASLAQKAAESMKITAPDLKELGVIDEIIHEVKGGAHRDVKQQAEAIDLVLGKSLDYLLTRSKEELVEERYQKYKKIGEYTFVNDVIPIK